MADLKFKCESCGEAIVIDDSEFVFASESANRIYGQEFDCPVCGKKTRAWKWKPLFNKAQDSPKAYSELPTRHLVSSTTRNNIRRHAEFLLQAAKCFAGGAVFAFVVTWLAASSEESDTAWIVGSAISGSLLTVAFWLYLIGQIVHIRANTHKD